jgi:G3E family GTPase
LINHQKNNEFWSSITRAKGFFWLANYPRFAFTLQKAGARIFYQLDQPWWCEISKHYWGESK